VLRRRTAADIADERSWSLGHVAFNAETARSTLVKCVAATINAVVHALVGLTKKKLLLDVVHDYGQLCSRRSSSPFFLDSGSALVAS
jgi:hypothetical protein